MEGSEILARSRTSASHQRIEAAVATDAGRRKTNADAYLVDEPAGLLAVADGVGDTPRSGHVAQMALEAVRELFLPPWSLLPGPERSPSEAADRLALGVMQANGRLYAPGRRGAERLATTFAGAVVCADLLCVGHAGDSRVYLFRPGTGKLARVTEDHTVLNDAYWRGVPHDIAVDLPDAHALTRAVGARAALEVRPVVQRWAPGDMLVVCTDGLTDRLDGTAIARALSEPGDIAIVAQRLVQRANDADGQDNATVVLARWIP